MTLALVASYRQSLTLTGTVLEVKFTGLLFLSGPYGILGHLDYSHEGNTNASK